MTNPFGWLLDSSGFTPRALCGPSWTASLQWIHVGSDVLIGLAYIAIPLTLLFLVRRRGMPFGGLVWLFGAFILACGLGHLIESAMFEYPVYRLSAAVKVLTAGVSWLTVVALIPSAPRVARAIDTLSNRNFNVPVHEDQESDRPGIRKYVVAVLAATLAMLVRIGLEPVMAQSGVYILQLLAVATVAWYAGLWPALVTLILTTVASVYLFLEPKNSFVVTAFPDQLAVGLFMFAGFGFALLGESQRQSSQKAGQAYRALLAKQTELEAEVARRKQSEDRFKTFIDESPGAKSIKTPDGRHLVINRAFTVHLGRPPEELLGKRDAELFPPEVARILEAEDREVRSTGQGRRFEVTIPIGGQTRTYLTAKFPLPDGTIGTIGTDITDRKRQELALRDSEDRFRTLAEAVPQIVWVTRKDGCVEYFNRQWYDYTGMTEDDSVGWGWSHALHPEDKARSEARWKHTIETGEPYEIEYRFRRADGTYRWFLGRALPQKDETGNVIRWFGTTTDIDEFKRVREDLSVRIRRAALRADVASALSGQEGQGSPLQRCAELLERHLDAALVRIWTLNETDQVLELQASAGMYTHTNGPHTRIRVGEFKIGRIAASRQTHTTNDVRNDPNISNPDWAASEGMVALGGYPLEVSGRLVGVLALFARYELCPSQLEDIAPVIETLSAYLDRKRSETALRSSEERFRLLTEAIPQVVWNASPDGHATYFNTRWLKYTGLSPEQARGDGWLSAVHPDDRDLAAADWERAVSMQTDRFTRELRLRRVDGGYRWFLAVAVPLCRADGAVDQWIGSMADIHDQKEHASVLERLVAERTAALTEEIKERRRAEQEARSSQQFLDVILENVADGIVACDKNGTLTLFNRASREFHGLPAIPLPPDRWAEHYSLFRADGVTPMPTEEIPLWRALRGEQVRDVELVIAPRHGSPRVVLSSGQPLTDQDGSKLGAVVSMRDVTERKKADEQFRAFAAELARSNGELEKFAYVASHDLQEPLRKIQAFGDRLAAKFGPDLGEQGKEYVDRMLSSAGRMRQLINDLLTFSRVTSKIQPFSPVDLNRTVADALEDLGDCMQQTGGTVDVGPLPTIDADPTQVRQLFQNLIGNALKFRKPDVPPAVTLRAEMSGEPGAQIVRLTVSDNGIGFDEKYLDRIFQVFQRLHGRQEYEGTGVGLAICRKIVERHGGDITATSSPGRGATFIVTLPVRQPTRGPI